jgi:Zn finger protein HypA/HybF involved in hydrogenase expression
VKIKHDFECLNCGIQCELDYDSDIKPVCPGCGKQELEIIWHKGPEFSPKGYGWPRYERRMDFDSQD